MTRMSFTARAVVTVTLLLALAAPASAAPDERAAARAFADAALTYTREARAAVPEARRRYAVMDLPRCIRAFAREDRTGPRREQRLFEVFYAANLTPLFAPLVDPTARFVAALEAVPTGDPRLRSARAAWRVAAWQTRMYARAPEDTCARLEEWRRGGSRGLPLPEVDLRGLSATFDVGDTIMRKLDAGARRLVALGQTRRRAERLTGQWAFAPYDALLQEVEDDLDAIDD